MIFVLGELLSARPLIGLRFGFRPCDSVALLNPPDQLILLTSDGRPVVVGELTPALARGSGKLLPLALDLIPVHVSLPGGLRARVAPNRRAINCVSVAPTALQRDLNGAARAPLLALAGNHDNTFTHYSRRRHFDDLPLRVARLRA